MGIVYGRLQSFRIDDTTYQVRSVDEEHNIYYIVSRSGKVLCKVVMNERGALVSEHDIPGNLLSEIIRWIRLLYK